MNRFKSTLLLVLLALACSAFAQNTIFDTAVFGATFNGPISTSSDQNATKTSTDNFYNSTNNGIDQLLSVRIVDHDISVDRTSTDFYATQAFKNGEVQDDRKEGTYQGHIWVYIGEHFTGTDGIAYRRHVWTIIVDPRTVIIVMQQSATTVGASTDASAWSVFVNSLVIKKSCWLPEGCTK